MMKTFRSYNLTIRLTLNIIFLSILLSNCKSETDFNGDCVECVQTSRELGSTETAIEAQSAVSEPVSGLTEQAETSGPVIDEDGLIIVSNEKRDPPEPALSLSWLEGDQNDLPLVTASWKASASPNIASQAIRFYHDGECSKVVGDEAMLEPGVQEKVTFIDDGMVGSFKIKSVDSEGAAVDSACSSLIKIQLPRRQIATGIDHTCRVDSEGRISCWGQGESGQLGLGPVTSTLMTNQYVATGLDQKFIAVSAGSYHSCALTELSEIWCWGKNDHGQVGVSDQSFVRQPVRPVGIEDRKFRSIASGQNHNCAIDFEYRVWCWGLNANGQLGTNDKVGRPTPVLIDIGSHRVGEIGLGADFSCVKTFERQVLCWGNNTRGQLGIATPTERLGLVGGNASVTMTEAKFISAGSQHFCMIRLDRGVWCWGENAELQLSRPRSVSFSSSPVQIAGVVAQSVGIGRAHSCVVDMNSEVVCWGANFYGQVGSGTTSEQLDPIRVQKSPAMKATNVVSSYEHSCISSDGGLMACWGRNLRGQLGKGDYSFHRYLPSQPVNAPSQQRWKQLVAGGAHSCGLTESGAVYCWGANEPQRLGYSIAGQRALFSVPANAVDFAGEKVRIISLGTRHSCALLESGSIACWGQNDRGQLGSGNRESIVMPKSVRVSLKLKARSISSAFDHNCAILEDGTVQCWGANECGQAGPNDRVVESCPNRLTAYDVLSPVAVLASADGFATIVNGRSHSCGVTQVGNLSCWGDNRRKQLGLGLIDDSNLSAPSANTPEYVSYAAPLISATGVAKISAGANFTCVVSATASLFCFGSNDSYQLGSRDRRDGSLIVPAVAKTISMVSAGSGHVCAIESSTGKLLCWGGNGFGQVGDGTNSNVASPGDLGVRFPGQLNVKKVIEASAGSQHSCAILEDGSGFCFGSNSDGQLGVGGFHATIN